MRPMAFSATIAQILAQAKYCTRREASGAAGRLRAGQMIRAVDRIQGLARGGHARTLAVLRVVDVRPAPPITASEVTAEGFEGRAPEFVEAVLRRMHGDAPLVRVGFEYLAIAAPRLLELTGAQQRPARARRVGDDARSRLAALHRSEPAWADLRALRDLADRELLLTPDDHRAACVELKVSPMELWCAPRAAKARRAAEVDDGQIDLFR